MSSLAVDNEGTSTWDRFMTEDVCLLDNESFKCDKTGNFTEDQIFQVLAPSRKDAVIKKYRSSPILVKTKLVPIEVLKEIVTCDIDLFGFLVVQKGANVSNDRREGLKLKFGGSFTTITLQHQMHLGETVLEVKKFSLSSENKTLRPQMDKLIEEHWKEKQTFEESRELKLQMYKCKDSLEIINWTWAKKGLKRRRSPSDKRVGNLAVEKNAEIAGSLNVRGGITGAVISTGGADLAEWRPICNETKLLKEKIGTLHGRVVIRAKSEYTIIFPDHVESWYEVLVVSSKPGVVIGEQNKEQFPNCERIVVAGYAPVCFIGDVKKHDFLMPSGMNDGTAKAFGGINSSLLFAMAAEDGNNETGMVNALIYSRPYPQPARPARLHDISPDFDLIVKNVIREMKEDSKDAQNLIRMRCENLRKLSPKFYRETISDILKTALDGPDRGKFTRFKKALTAEIRRVKAVPTKSRQRRINLRSYQKELVRRVKDRTRSIVVLPTGTGKTFIAAEVIYERLKKMEDKISIFLCTTNPLRMQQENELREYISSQHDYDKNIRVASLVSEATNQHALENTNNALYVMTAGGFDNVVATEKLLNHIDLIVLDEIHHLECNNKKHPYNKIVKTWHDVDLLGLTATPAASITDNSTRKRFESLLKSFHTDDDGFLQVIEEKEDLNKFCNKTEFTTQPVVMDPADKDCIKLLEEFIRDLEMDLEDNISFKLAFPDEKDVYGYQVKVTAMAKTVLEKMKGHQKAMLYRSQLIFLSYLSEGLSLVKNLGHKYAREHISRRGRSSILTDGSNDSKEFLDKVESLLLGLESAQNANPECQHPKFMEMKKTILSYTAQAEEHRCKVLVFAETRRVVMELSCRINSDPDFISNNICCDFLLGSSSKSHPGRPNGLQMSQDKQLQKLENFKYGKVDVLVATTIAEEGIDITKCNLVIQYDVSPSGKCLQQRAGRARALNSVVHSIYFADACKKFDETKALHKSEVEQDRMNNEIQERAKPDRGTTRLRAELTEAERKKHKKTLEKQKKGEREISPTK